METVQSPAQAPVVGGEAEGRPAAGAHGVFRDAEVRFILERARRIAVVGLSSREERPSYQVARYLQQQGYTICPVNPARAGQTILGRQVFDSLASVPMPLDIVAVFRRATDLPDVVEDVIAAHAQWHLDVQVVPTGPLWVIWMPLDVVNSKATDRAHAAGLAVVENRCISDEHTRLHGASLIQDQPSRGLRLPGGGAWPWRERGRDAHFAVR